MEYLRWILLAAGIFFILAIYLMGRQRRRHKSSNLFDSKEELPEFSATDWDNLDEGVGKVRVIARENSEVDYSAGFSAKESAEVDSDSAKLDPDDDQEENLSLADDLFVLTEEVEPSVVESDEVPAKPRSNVDIIVLYILAKSSGLLTGDKINSAAQANGLVFGSMNIFHHLDADEQTIFSLANMVEPGNFDPDSIHEMTTTGLTGFMQLSNLKNPADDFDEMLRCAYHISEMLDANLCNQNRQHITQSYAEYYWILISEKENT
mgnify:CR=1 FL=1